MTDDRLTAAEAAEITGKSRRTIGRLLDAGRLPGAELTPKGWRIPRAALDDLAETTDDRVTGPELQAALVEWQRRRAEATGPTTLPTADTEPTDTTAELRAELEEWRRRAKVAARRSRRRAAELAEWQRRAEVAEAVATERAAALADARSALVLAQRLAALNLAENAPYRTAAVEITEQATPSTVRRWIPRRWKLIRPRGWNRYYRRV